MKRILHQPWGGLGDNLQFSTLPEIYHILGYEVWMHSDNAYRNKGIHDLIMMNPYIKGITNESPNIGSCVSILDGVQNNNPNFVAKVEYFHFGRSFNNYPVIYYTPKVIDFFVGRTVVDINSISHNVYLTYLNNTDVKNPIYLNDGGHSYNTKNIFEYIDIIFSCETFVCSFSGGSVLASAIKNQFKNELNIDCYVTQSIMNYQIRLSYLYYFDNVNYKLIKE